ncbi:peptidyl-tRNA hydrolase [Rhizobium laguerreae]|uniref:aminoacyl-tRNA hydrolase n=1 Tax=Rhizobium laguerreae TaxID=1076926 RepID=UPI001C928F85|nr:aminoacyl-tRNA hydrolase [Rhizobium laguerreae]MBY3155335.1 peptidyl-tRNA hydrolase [Rhizobium laguerreae]
MYAVVRRDLDMPPGKLSAQAGHAYTASLFECIDTQPHHAKRYRLGLNAGTKVTLYCRDEREIRDLEQHCRAVGVPHALFTDEGHVMPPHFDGSPVVTALGIGPLRRIDAKPLVRKFRCV